MTAVRFPLDALGQEIEAGDVVVYTSGSRTSTKRIGQVIATKQKVRVHFFDAKTGELGSNGPGATFEHDGQHYPAEWDVEWLAPGSLVVVTGFKSFRPKAAA